MPKSSQAKHKAPALAMLLSRFAGNTFGVDEQVSPALSQWDVACGVVCCAEGAVTRRQWPGCLPTGTGKREGCVS